MRTGEHDPILLLGASRAHFAKHDHGAEARLRYGLLLKRRGNEAEANRVLKDLPDGVQLGPAHYGRAQAEWLERARRELS